MKNPKLKKADSKVPRVIFELVYRIQLKRLSLGYTQQDVDFFLGFGRNYWKSIEDFSNSEKLTIADLLCLSDAFKCSVDDFIYPVDDYLLQRKLTIKIITSRNQRFIIRKAFQVKNSNSILLYQLLENLPVHTVPNSVDTQIANTTVAALYRNGFFDAPKDTVEIYHACKEWANKPIKPLLIEKALKPYLLSNNLVKPRGENRHDTMASAYKSAFEI